MAKRIVQLNETTSVNNASYFAVDTTASTNKLSFANLKAAILGSITTDLGIHVVQTCCSSTGWWRLWSDGWCEQGGFLSSTAGNNKENLITLFKPYKDTDYFIQISRQRPYGCGAPQADVTIKDGSKTTSSFRAYSICNATHTKIYWETKGKVS